MAYEIIDNYNYSIEDINELVHGEDDLSNNYLKSISYLLMFGTTVLSVNHMNAESREFDEKDSTSLIEVVNLDTSFEIDDYAKNTFSLENYSFCKNNKKSNIWTEKILSFKSLQESWDGYGAVPLEIKSASNAIFFLETLSEKSNIANLSDIFPNPHGTLSLIWENIYNERLSLEIGNNSMSYYYTLNSNSPKFFNNIEIDNNNIETIARTINSLF